MKRRELGASGKCHWWQTKGCCDSRSWLPVLKLAGKLALLLELACSTRAAHLLVMREAVNAAAYLAKILWVGTEQNTASIAMGCANVFDVCERIGGVAHEEAQKWDFSDERRWCRSCSVFHLQMKIKDAAGRTINQMCNMKYFCLPVSPPASSMAVLDVLCALIFCTHKCITCLLNYKANDAMCCLLPRFCRELYCCTQLSNSIWQEIL